MKKNLIILSTIVLGVSSCDMYGHDRHYHHQVVPGEYDQTRTSVDAAGTKTVEKTSSDVKIDSKGHKKIVVKSKTTRDPKGLMNKTTTSKSTDAVDEEDGKTTTSHEEEENKGSSY